MSDFDTERDPVDVLAEEFAERWRRGDRPSVGDYAARFPQWAGKLRTVLPSVAKLEQLKRCREAATTTLAPIAAPEMVGDYRIVREVGRGGMGIVFEAVQASLGRRVALKILPSQFLLDRKRLERFQREAQAAARLHHTNIVQVFGVGEQEGFHYYVMQYIDGKGLNEVLAEWRRAAGLPARRSSEETILEDPTNGASHSHSGSVTAINVQGSLGDECWRAVARIGVQIADGLHHAHQHGIVHRDLKPGNILLEPDDKCKTSVEPVNGSIDACTIHPSSFILHHSPKITDFGLAKLADHEDLTRTGDILGTVGYMAPECFLGRADARSDIYALGLTLYEMLTLRPPFPETNPARLIRQVSEQEPVRPRKLNPAMPRDLETIILKAIAREPERRYQTAMALAEDLNRYLDDRPILARRTRAPERLWRWCRRNRALAALGGVALACFLLAFAVGWIGYVHTRRALDGESKKSAEAKQATELAEANVKLSLEHFEEIFDRLADKASMPSPREGKFGAGKFPKVSEEDAALMNSILSFYDQFTEQNTTNPRLQLEAAKAQRRAGDIHRRLNQPDKASAAYQRAAGMLIRLSEQYPGESRYRFELVQTLLLEDPSSGNAEQLREAEERVARALFMAQKLATAEPASSDLAALRSRCHARLAVVQQQRGNVKDAEANFREALAIQETLALKSPRDSSVTHDLVSTRLALADCLLAKGQPAEARAVLDESIKHLRSQAKDEWRFRWRGGLLASHYLKLATALARLGLTDLAAEAARNASKPRPFKGGRAGG